MSSQRQKFDEILEKFCQTLMCMSLKWGKLQMHWSTLPNGKTAGFVKTKSYWISQQREKYFPQLILTKLSFFWDTLYVRIFFVRVIPVRSSERAAKRDLPAKIGNRNEKSHGHNFRRRAPKTNSVLKKWVSKDAIRFGTSPSKIVAVGFFVTVYFL